MPKISKQLLMWIIVLIYPLCGFAVDIYTPSLPIITHYLGASHSAGKLTVAIYIFGFGLGQLIAGPLSDRFGRKIILQTTLISFAGASLLATLSHSIGFLLVMRLLQGLSVAGQILCARTTLIDLFEGPALRHAFVYASSAWTLSPVIGPAIGGYLQTYVGWRAGFVFLAVYALAIFILLQVYLHETNQKRQKLQLKQMLASYVEVLTCWRFMRYVLGLVIGFSLINTFNVLGPFIIQVQLHHSALFYAHIALLIGLFCFLGSFANRFLLKRMAMESVIWLTIWGSVLVAVFALVLSHFLPMSVCLLAIPVIFIIFFTGMSYPNFSTNCASMFKPIAGIASAARGATTMFGAAIVTSLISFFPIHTVSMMLLVYFVLLLLLLFVFLKKH